MIFGTFFQLTASGKALRYFRRSDSEPRAVSSAKEMPFMILVAEMLQVKLRFLHNLTLS